MPESDSSAASRALRGSARFEVALRVEYEINRQRWFVTTRNLSMGGMEVSLASQLEVGSETRFHLTLPAVAAPVAVRGKVVRVTKRSTHIQFIPNQEPMIGRLRAYAFKEVLPALQTEAKRDNVSIKRICELASLYGEMNRFGEVMALFRRVYPQHFRDRRFLESMACLWLQRLDVAPAAERAMLGGELREMCNRAQMFESPVFNLVRQRLQAPPPQRQPVESQPSASSAEPVASTSPAASVEPVVMDYVDDDVELVEADPIADFQEPEPRKHEGGTDPTLVPLVPASSLEEIRRELEKTHSEAARAELAWRRERETLIREVSSLKRQLGEAREAAAAQKDALEEAVEKMRQASDDALAAQRAEANVELDALRTEVAGLVADLDALRSQRNSDSIDTSPGRPLGTS